MSIKFDAATLATMVSTVSQQQPLNANLYSLVNWNLAEFPDNFHYEFVYYPSNPDFYNANLAIFNAVAEQYKAVAGSTVVNTTAGNTVTPTPTPTPTVVSSNTGIVAKGVELVKAHPYIALGGVAGLAYMLLGD